MYADNASQETDGSSRCSLYFRQLERLWRLFVAPLVEPFVAARRTAVDPDIRIDHDVSAELIDPLCVTEMAGLCLHNISYTINFAVDLIHSCFILKIIVYNFISFTGLSVCDRSFTI